MKDSPKNSDKKSDVVEFLKTFIIAIAIMLFIRMFIIQPFVVKGSSMESNFFEHDYLIINEFLYNFKNIERGDVIVFKYKNAEAKMNEYLIKRVIGLPGETVTIKDGKVYIIDGDGCEFVLQEDYLDLGTTTSGNLTEEIKANNYFVLGDNRSVSLDSRYIGQIPKKVITGKAVLRGFPFNKAGLLKFDKPVLNLNENNQCVK